MSKFIFRLLLLFFVGSIFSGCKKDFFEKELVGRWRIDTYRIVEQENNLTKSDTSLSNVGFLRLKEDLTGEFEIGGATTAITFFSSNGTYAYLTIKDPSSDRQTVITYLIKTKSGSNMEWENIQDQSVYIAGLPRIDRRIIKTLSLRK